MIPDKYYRRMRANMENRGVIFLHTILLWIYTLYFNIIYTLFTKDIHTYYNRLYTLFM
jgi:hypothetical protein